MKKGKWNREDHEKLEFLWKAGKTNSDLAEIFEVKETVIVKQLIKIGLLPEGSLPVPAENQETEPVKDPDPAETIKEGEAGLKDEIKKKGKAVEEMPEPEEIFVRTLEIKLSNSEIMEKGKELAMNESLKFKIQVEKKTVMDEYNGKINQFDAMIGKLTRIIENGTEPRDLRCFYKYNHPKSGYKTLIIEETGKAYETVPMLDEEKEDLFKATSGGSDEEGDNDLS